MPKRTSEDIMITKKELKFSGYYKLEELTIKLKSDNQIKREFLTNKDGVTAIVYDKLKKKFIFVSQWRPCSEDYIVEAVAGSIELNETPEEAVEKEILEETGYKLDTLEFVDSFYVSPGTISEKVYLFFATVSEQINNGGGKEEEQEEIDIIYYDFDEVINFDFSDAKTIIAKNFLEKKLK